MINKKTQTRMAVGGGGFSSPLKKFLDLKQSKKGIKAFTLAEVLITLTIIGVVSAMTIPTLMNRYEAIQLRSAFLTANSVVKSVAGTMNSVGDHFDDISAEEISKYFKASEFKNTASNPYMNFHGTRKASDASANPKISEFKFQNGMTALVFKTNPSYSGTKKATKNLLAVDINGKDKKPNRYGHDVYFWYHSDISEQIEVMGSVNSKEEFGFWQTICQVEKVNSSEAENGIGCGARALVEQKWFENLKNQKYTK